MYARILVPIDGSKPSQLALNEGIRLASALGAAIRVLHVLDVRSLVMIEVSGSIYNEMFESARREGEAVLRSAERQVRDAGIAVDAVLLDNPDIQVGESIVRTACEYQAELIICGTHGRRGIRRLLVGSDAEYVVRHSSVPVLLVRSAEGLRATETPASGAAAHRT